MPRAQVCVAYNVFRNGPCNLPQDAACHQRERHPEGCSGGPAQRDSLGQLLAGGCDYHPFQLCIDEAPVVPPAPRVGSRAEGESIENYTRTGRSIGYSVPEALRYLTIAVDAAEVCGNADTELVHVHPVESGDEDDWLIENEGDYDADEDNYEDGDYDDGDETEGEEF